MQKLLKREGLTVNLKQPIKFKRRSASLLKRKSKLLCTRYKKC